jgi:hypothetical protein
MIIEKPTFNVSKKFLRLSTNSIPLQKVETIKYKACEGCPFFNSTDPNAIRYCNEFCEEKTQIKVVDRISIVGKETSSTLRLSNSQIKQMLCYYYMSDSNGVVLDIIKNELSSILGCTQKTIDNNNYILQELGLIIIGNKHYGSFSVVINNYSNQHTEKGDGYVVMSKEVFDCILSSKNVNATRVINRFILKYDMNVIMNADTILSAEELKDLLPTNLHLKKAINNIVQNLPSNSNYKDGETSYSSNGAYSAFTIISKNGALIFSMNRIFDGKTKRNNIKSTARNYFNEYFKENNFSRGLESIDDIVSLSTEYGYAIVKIIVEQLSEEEFDKVSNLGGYIRENIRNYIELNAGLFDKVI